MIRSRRPGARPGLAARALALVLVALPAQLGSAAEVDATSVELTPCNRTYRMRGAALAPVTQGGLTIALTSPENELTLTRNRLELTPRGDGTHDARFVAAFSGGGELVADVDAGGLASRLEDRVAVPPQERTVEARVRLARGPAGYEITPLELPEHVVVEIDSQLAHRFATLCDTLSLVPGLGLDCNLLRAALSRARVPMPEPGETYLLPPECVTEEAAHRLDAYLAGAAKH